MVGTISFISDSAKMPTLRALRFIDWDRLRMPWRMPAGFMRILPVAVKRNRFFADDFVFSLGIFSSRAGAFGSMVRHALGFNHPGLAIALKSRGL